MLVALLAVATALVAVPVVIAWRFALLYPPRPTAADGPWPPAAVLLCLRGADPSLGACVGGLLALDYPSYEVVIVVDGPDDPALPLVGAALAAAPPGSPPVRVEVLREAPATCSLKLGAQAQALDGLAAGCEVVALIDADVVPDRGWLRSLVAALRDPGVGASTGFRWYTPQDERWGTLVRYFWNFASVCHTAVFGVPWGGSLAWHLGRLGRDRLRARLTHSFSEDTACAALLRRLGLRLALVPQATMVCPETIDLRRATGFIRRQLLCVRLHHPRWGVIVGSCIAWGAALTAVVALIPLLLLCGGGLWVAWPLTLVGAFLLGALSALWRVERHLRRRAAQRGEPFRGFPPSWRALPALALTAAVNLVCLVAAQWTRRVSWRGIDYAVESGAVRRLNYRPFTGAAGPAERGTSVD